MIRSSRPAARLLLLSALVALSGCAGTHVSKFEYDPRAHQVNVPASGEGCYDACVLLAVDAARTRDIAGKVLAALDATVTESSDSGLKAQRNRHIGVFVGSGGEVLGVTWKVVDPGRTFVTATTKTGFVGGAGQKAWSCEVVAKMAELASK
ncbi:hypothetical protein AnaeK_0946 [Anaeromyxobacter sp. K]|uniref:hypothetical protein n=1 Tax=Anaeromyxobacter sp. (strain K) TaxID=447217 RepID=UPI00015F88E4|nr:hypothetical protein [Anaeromyxobacter sp. K]ACG72181.1 hypothetical protein AnaeK_0946 [Anaeromyxobacter sp. K]